MCTGQARNAMPAGRTIGQQMPASARDTSRWLQALQTPRPRHPVHPARRVRRSQHSTAPGQQRTAPDILPCRRCPQRPWLRVGRPPRARRSAGEHVTAADAAEPLQLPGWQRAASSRNSVVVRRCTAGKRRGQHQCRRSAPAKTRGRAKHGGKMFASRGGCGSPSNCGASHGGHAAHLVEEDRREAGFRLRSRAEF